MFERRSSVFTLLAALGVSASTTAPPAAVLRQPVTNWNLDYGEVQCVAARGYGDASNPITLGIRPAPNGESYELLVRLPRSGPVLAKELPGSVDFGPGPIKAWLLYYGVKGQKASLYQFRIPASEMAKARSATAVTFHANGGEDFSFALMVMPAVLDGLEKCTSDLKRYWNMGGEKDGRIARPATTRGDLRAVFTNDDYPSDAYDRRQEGDARLLLLISETGSVAGCHVEVASGVPALDAMGCQIIRERAKFEPARDAAGKPIKSTVVTPPISWRME
jgi:TonB family protein